MADHEYAFSSSATPNSFAIGKTGITGIDEVGGLTPKIVRLHPSATIVLTAAFTDAELATLMRQFLQRLGSKTDGSSGGSVAQGSIQETPALTEVPAAD
jgi:hypothetical protein